MLSFHIYHNTENDSMLLLWESKPANNKEIIGLPTLQPLLNIICLIHWGRVTHICVGKLTIIVSDNSLPPGRCQAIIWTNAGLLLIGPLGTNFSEILIEILTFSFKKLHLKVSSAKWHPFCLSLNVLMAVTWYLCSEIWLMWQYSHKASEHDSLWWPGSYFALGFLQPSSWRQVLSVNQEYLT